MDKDTNKCLNIKAYPEDDEVKGLIEHGHGNRSTICFYWRYGEPAEEKCLH